MRVLMFGTFDGLHPGHRFILEEGQKRGDLTVVVARDSTVLRIKKHPPIQGEEERKRVIEEAFPDIDVMLGNEADFLAPVRMVDPDLILLGYDQALPPGVVDSDLPCPTERLPALDPEKYKSSLLRDTRENT